VIFFIYSDMSDLETKWRKLLFFKLLVNRLADEVGNNNSPDYQYIDHRLSPKKTFKVQGCKKIVKFGYRILLRHKKKYLIFTLFEFPISGSCFTLPASLFHLLLLSSAPQGQAPEPSLLMLKKSLACKHHRHV
jgi:hypothetical protein